MELWINQKVLEHGALVKNIALFVILASAFLFLTPVWKIILLIVVMELAKEIVRIRYNLRNIPLYFSAIGSIYVSTVYGFNFGIIVLLFNIVIKLAFFDLKRSFIERLLYLIPMCYLASLFDLVPYVSVIIFFVGRYLLEIIFESLLGYLAINEVISKSWLIILNLALASVILA
ncbi:MAG: hypothetical protein NDI94_01950 [Candidatus Woesearchaeota archaeon]|nr:hypothetical protein [Candidatus Woesearchaeota archaeon]